MLANLGGYIGAKHLWRRAASFGLEVVRVDPFDRVRLRSANADIKINQKLRQLQAVNQHDLGVDRPCILDGVSGKATRGKKYSLLGTFSVKCSDEFLNLGSPNRVVPTLGVQVYDVLAESVLVDHPINSSVVSVRSDGSSIIPGAAIAHFQHQVDN